MPDSRLFFPHRLPLEVDSVAVVEQPVADAFRRARLPDDLVPLGDGHGAGDDDAALEVALLDDVEEDFALLGLEHVGAEVVED